MKNPRERQRPILAPQNHGSVLAAGAGAVAVAVGSAGSAAGFVVDAAAVGLGSGNDPDLDGSLGHNYQTAADCLGTCSLPGCGAAVVAVSCFALTCRCCCCYCRSCCCYCYCCCSCCRCCCYYRYCCCYSAAAGIPLSHKETVAFASVAAVRTD